MDGTRADKFVNGHLDRPAPISAIIRDYPDIVIGLISGLCSVTVITSPIGPKNILVTLPFYQERRFLLREEDFDACKRVAVLFSQNSFGPVSAFLSEPTQDLKNRIVAYLRVEFAGRDER